MPSKIVAKIILFLVLVFLVLTSVFLFILSNPQRTAGAALYFLKRFSPEVIFKEITIDEMHWDSLEKVSLRNLRVKCKIKGMSYFFSSGAVDIDSLRAFVTRTPLFVNIKNLAIVSDSLNVSDIQADSDVYFQMFHYQRLQAFLTAGQLEWEHYLVEDLKGNFNDQQGRLDFSDVQGHCYGGSIQLKGWLEHLNGISYDMEAQLSGINSSLLAADNPVFGQVAALVNGPVKVKDVRNKGLLIKASLSAPQGGSMKASLLRYLARYVPQRKQVEDLIREDANVTLNKLQAKITSLDREKLAAEVILNSSSLNLNMDVKFDIHIEGGIDHLLEYIHQ